MSLSIIPADSNAASAKASSTSTPLASSNAAASVHDTLRNHGAYTVHDAVNGRHPLEARLAGWKETQEQVRMEMLGRLFGAHEPIRRGMEKKIVLEDEFRYSGLGRGGNVHLDILSGTDASVMPEDIFDGSENIQGDFHAELERKVRMAQ